MAIEAELHDGTILEFPDGTDPEVIRSTVRRRIGVSTPAKPSGEQSPTAEELETASRPAQAIRLKGGRQVALVRPEATRDNWDKETQGTPRAAWTGEGSVLEAAPGLMVAGGRSAAANLRRLTAEESASARRSALGVRPPNAEEIDDYDMRGEAIPKEVQVFDPATSGETPGGAVTGRVRRGAIERQRALLAKDEASIKAATQDANTSALDLKNLTPANMDTAQQAVSSLIQSAPPTMLGIAAGILTRNPVLAMTIAGGGGSALQAGSTYAEAREKGATHRTSALAATIDGILEGVGEALPLGIALKQGSPIANRIFGTIVAEAGQEAATQAMQDMNALLTYNPEITLAEAWQNLKVAALSGAIGGSVYGTVGAVADASRQRAINRDAATDLKTGTEVPANTTTTPPPEPPADTLPPTENATPPGDIMAEEVPEGEATAMQLAFREAQRKAGTRVEPVDAQTEADIEAAGANVNTEPTEAQKEAGNYAKGHIKLLGLDIAIENPKGSTRSGTDPNGQPWEVTMPAAYGYVKRSEGADGDQVDVYLGPDPKSRQVFVIDQIDSDTREFDEHKVMLGFTDQSDAVAAYDAAFADGKGGIRRGAITPMAMGDFKKWLKKGDTKTPYAYQFRSPVYDALQDEKLQTTVLSMKSALGAQERGGRLIIDEANRDRTPGFGDVVGKTAWIGEQWWFGRPDQSISAEQARKAIDKAIAGEKLGARELRFVEYVVDMAKEVEAQFAGIDDNFLDTAGYNELSPEEKATLDQVIADAVAVLGESTVEDIKERLAIQTESEAEYEARLREELEAAVVAAGNSAETGIDAQEQQGQSAERGQQGSRAPPENEGGVDGQGDSAPGEVAGEQDSEAAVSGSADGTDGRDAEDAGQSADSQEVNAAGAAIAPEVQERIERAREKSDKTLGGKSPHEINWIVWSDAHKQYLKDAFGVSRVTESELRAAHLDFIETALEDGKTVPSESFNGHNKIDAEEYPLAAAEADRLRAARPAQPDDESELELTGETPAELAAKAQQEAAQKQSEAAQAMKEAADKMAETFTLTGSSRTADEAAARGQSDLLSQPETPAATPEPAIPAAPVVPDIALTASQIPTDVTITLEVQIEETGEVGETELNGREAFKEAQRKIKRLQALRGCLTK